MKDLTNIPERFHTLFTTDWNNGNESVMKSLQRVEMNELYLQYNKWEIQDRLIKKIEDGEKTIVGFTKD